MNIDVRTMNPLGLQEESSLSFQALMDLIDGRCLALRIRDFYPESHCAVLTEQMRAHSAFGRYSMAEDVPVQRIGMTLFETEQKAEKLETYFQEALATPQVLRNICSPYMNPLDLFRLRLEELWPEGARILKLQGRKMLPGIARMFESNAQGGLPPHQDILERDMPDLGKSINPKVQLAANIYLEVAPQGGELELWDFAPSQEEVGHYLNGQYDFLDRAKLPDSSLCIKPGQGDLIIMKSENIHAVHPSSGGTRIAMSCFLGYYGMDQVLRYWA